MKVIITKELWDKANAVRETLPRSTNCPVALAIAKALGQDHLLDYVPGSESNRYSQGVAMGNFYCGNTAILLPPEARLAERLFDAHHLLRFHKPIEFEVRLVN